MWRRALATLPRAGPGLADFTRAAKRTPPPPPPRQPVPGVGAIVAVSSAKGGVGKSTVAVNLAAALAAAGVRVGLLDADVHGPSTPRLLNVAGESPATSPTGALLPVANYGVRTLSMGLLMRDGAAAVWRGPMVMSALETLTRKADWSGTDLLIIDTPPGTGDAHLSLAQRLPLVGAVVVTTPSSLSADDAARGAAAWAAAGVRVLGVVENMAGHVCSACGARDDVFGAAGPAGDAVAAAAGAPVLARVPLSGSLRAAGDEGAPVVIADPDSVAAAELRAAADAVWRAVQAAKTTKRLD